MVNDSNLATSGGLSARGTRKPSSPVCPLVSIVTVVRNRRDVIEQAMRSVLAQTYSNVEYIVIDGASTDGTADIVQSFDARLDYWVSEPDRGIYDAMNKGIRLATGELVGILNSDDWFERDAVERMVDAYLSAPFDYSYGSVRKVDPLGRELRVLHPTGNPEIWRGKWMQGLPFCHVSCFVRRSVYQHLGEFDLRYQVCADCDMFLRFLEHRLTARRVPGIMANCRAGGISDSIYTLWENMLISIHHGQPVPLAFLRYLMGVGRRISRRHGALKHT